jgi:hypothetical protein
MIGYLQRKWIDHCCPGYSWVSHWNFFHRLMTGGAIRSIAILGVYLGRDIAYMSHALRSAGIRDYHITGIDRFADRPGEDWPQEKRALSWEDAGYGHPPTLVDARANLGVLGYLDNVTLIRGEAEELLGTHGRYDFIYIDICHDHASTAKAIRLASAKIYPTGIIGGDDYSDKGTWGVPSAVKEMFARYDVFDEWIWSARAGDLRRGEF